MIKSNSNLTGTNFTLTGQKIDIALHWQVIPGYENSLEHVLVEVVDITQRKQAEASERQSHQFTETLQIAGNLMTESLDFDEILDRILDLAGTFVPYDFANILLVEDGVAHPSRARGYERFTALSDEELSQVHYTVNDTANLRYMVDTRQPMLIPDVHQFPGWIPDKASAHIRSWVGVPLFVANQAVAFLSLDKIEPGYYTPEHATRLGSFAAQASLALENGMLYRQAQRRITELSILNEISRILSSALVLQDLLEMVYQQVGRIFQTDEFYIAAHHPNTQHLGDVIFCGTRDTQPVRASFG